MSYYQGEFNIGYIRDGQKVLCPRSMNGKVYFFFKDNESKDCLSKLLIIITERELSESAIIKEISQRKVCKEEHITLVLSTKDEECEEGVGAILKDVQFEGCFLEGGSAIGYFTKELSNDEILAVCKIKNKEDVLSWIKSRMAEL